jgi:hypothetical protein
MTLTLDNQDSNFGDKSTAWMAVYYLHERHHHHRLTKFANPNMTYVSDDRLWWPVIDTFRLISYFVGLWRARSYW